MTVLRPALDADALARAFPFHLWLDDGLRVRAFGASLAVAMPELAVGDALGAHFESRRPRGAATLDDWRAHGRALVTLKGLQRPALMLRGNAEWPAQGGLLLVVSPVLTSLDAVRRLGLGFEHFAPHDAAAELLLAAGGAQMAARDAERMAERLRARTRQLDSVVELSDDGIAFFDPEGALQQVNPALLAMLGLARAQVLGATRADLQRHLETLLDDDPAPPRVFDAAPGTEPPERALVLRRPEHRVLQVKARHAEDGASVFYLSDVTAATEVDRMKSEFLTTAAHELRTPMVSVFGFTELLLNRPVTEERRRDMLQTIHRQSQLLISMVNELLDLARIEARQGKDLKCAPCSAAALVQQALGMAAPGPRHELRLELPADGVQLFADPEKTVRALANVLSNAIKYSPDGGPVVVATEPGALNGAPALGIRIADRGIGMTPAQVLRVFERFWRADPSGNVPGTGLGMSLVKEIVELQGGRVQVWSQPGEGTAVTLWLPLARETAMQ